MKLYYYTAVAMFVSVFWWANGLCANDLKTNLNPVAKKGQNEITITADSLFANNKVNVAEFYGNVKAVQADTVITSERLKILYQGKDQSADKKNTDVQSIKKIVASGNVVITFDNRVAKSDQAVYTTEDKQLVLTGENAEIESGSDWIRGCKITLNRFDEKVLVEGCDGKQVKFRILPKGDGLN